MGQAQDWFAANAPKAPEPTEVGGYPVGTTVPMPRAAGRRLFVSPSQQAREEGTRTDYGRADNSLLGLPPELAVTSGIGVGRAALAGGESLASQAFAGAKAAITDVATPIAKYHIVKNGLQTIGLPGPLAETAAVVLSGYRGRGKAAPATAKPSVVEASPAAPSVPRASSPEVPAPAAAPSVPAAAPARPSTPAPSPQTRPSWLKPGEVLSEQRIQNELGIQARRQQVTLTEPQYKAATDLVSQGASPAEAVKEIASRVAPATTPAGSTAPAATAPSQAAPSKAKVPKRAKLTADEADEYLRLTGKGLSHEEAVEALLTQRKLAAKLGTPTPEDVRTRVSRRLARNNRSSEEQ